MKWIIKTLFKHKIGHKFSIVENVVMLCPKNSVVFTAFVVKAIKHTSRHINLLLNMNLTFGIK